jgi:hypothetical protein
MDGWMSKWNDGWKEVDGLMGGWMSKWIDGLMDE